jgi:lactoylglutathione lyase
MDNVETVTLFVDDLAEAKSFYKTIFGVTAVYEDHVSWVFRLGAMMVNLLQASEAGELLEPVAVARTNAAVKVMFTIRVSNVDVACGDLQEKGVKLLNGPIDRPWGRRTAAFADPDGNVWEVAQEI